MAVQLNTRLVNPPRYYMVGADDDVRKMMGAHGFLRTLDQDEAELVVFTGGPDINPIFYGEKRHPSTHISFNRDLADMAALRKWKGPYEQALVGICRGAQFLNVVVGHGSLWQNVNNHRASHDMKIVSTGELITTSSTHHQAMIPGPEANVVAWAAESTLKETHQDTITFEIKQYRDVEAVFYPEANTLCFQGHPEINTPNNMNARRFFLSYIEDNLMSHAQREALKDRRQEMKLNKPKGN